MAYRALYREWRPKDFSHVVGQKAIVETLRNQVMNQRIAHAYLFCGSRGTGKTSTAKILARAINCLEPVDGDPCGKCENCLRMEKEETLDVIEIDAASNNGVDEIRDLRDTVKYPPQYGKYKVYIIDEVHMLSPAAFNALLKTLEEPPAHIVFILATTEPQKLPETILSRCQRFDFGRLSIPELSGRLREAAEGSGATVSNGALMMIARAADGGMRDALSILDMCLGYRNEVDEELVRSILGTSDASFLFTFCSAFSEGDAAKIFRMIDEIMRDGKDPAVFARDVCRHVRALLMAKTSPEDIVQVLDITGEEAEEYIRQGENFTISRLMKILDQFMALETEMRYASTPRMALENTSLKCCLRMDEPDSQALNDRIAELEKKLAGLEKKLAEGGFHAALTGEQPVPSAKEAPSARSTAAAVKPAENQTMKVGAERDGKAAWKELMDRFKRTEPLIWSFLQQGKLADCKGDEFVWQANQTGAESMFAGPLNQPARKQKICDCLSEITGRTCSFRTLAQGEKAKAEDGADEAYLNRLYESFGAERVAVAEDMPK